MTRLVVVGGGRMGHALLGGLLRSGWAAPADLAVVEPLATARAELLERYPGILATETGVAADSAVLAVKPADAEAGCRTVAASGCQRVVSIVAGVTIAQLEGWIGNRRPRAASHAEHARRPRRRRLGPRRRRLGHRERLHVGGVGAVGARRRRRAFPNISWTP